MYGEVTPRTQRVSTLISRESYNWMHQGEIKVKQVAKQSMARADVGPRDVSRHIRTKSMQAILPLTS